MVVALFSLCFNMETQLVFNVLVLLYIIFYTFIEKLSLENLCCYDWKNEREELVFFQLKYTQKTSLEISKLFYISALSWDSSVCGMLGFKKWMFIQTCIYLFNTLPSSLHANTCSYFRDVVKDPVEDIPPEVFLPV